MVKSITVQVYHFDKKGKPRKYHGQPCFVVTLEAENDLEIFFHQLQQFNRVLDSEMLDLYHDKKIGIGFFKAEFYADNKLIATSTEITFTGQRAFYIGGNDEIIDAYIWDAESLIRAYWTGGNPLGVHPK